MNQYQVYAAVSEGKSYELRDKPILFFIFYQPYESNVLEIRNENLNDMVFLRLVLIVI